MPSIPKEALSLSELQELHDFLSAKHDNAKPMSVTACHGFLTAIISSPSLIMPSEYHEEMMGGHPNFKSKAETERIMMLLSQLNNSISRGLHDDTDNFEPLLFDGEQIIPYANATCEQIQPWCYGYLAGANYDDAWRAHDTRIALLIPFGILAGTFDLKGEKDYEGNIIEDDTTHKVRMKEKLPFIIRGFFNTFLSERESADDHLTPSNDPIIKPEKIGRNDNCPCGSGKKYKKCCLDDERTLH